MKLVHAGHLLGADGVQVTAGVDRNGNVYITVAGVTARLRPRQAGKLAAAVAQCAGLAGQHHAAGDQGGIPAVVLTAAQAALAARALEDAAEFRRERADQYCYECESDPAGACDDHAGDLDRAAEYADLAVMLPAMQAGQPAPGPQPWPESEAALLIEAIDAAIEHTPDDPAWCRDARRVRQRLATLAGLCVPAASRTTPGPASGQADGHSLLQSPREES